MFASDFVSRLLCALLVISLPMRGVWAEEDEFLERIPAPFMSYHGAPWLERHDREDTEKPDEVVAAMKLEPGDVVADIGCGTGYFARRIAKVVGEEGKVYGVDIQPEMLELLQKRSAEENIDNIVPVLGAPDDPKLPKGEIDAMILVDVYHEFSDARAMLAKMREALAPDGRIALVEYRVEDGTGDHIKPDHRMSARQVLIEWEPAGFELLELHEFLPHQHLFIFGKSGDEPNAEAVEQIDLTDALAKGHVAIESARVEDDAVVLNVRRNAEERLIVTLPAGQYFRSEAENLDRVARRDGMLPLFEDGAREWKVLAVPAGLDGAAESDGAVQLTVAPVSENRDLRRVMFFLQAGGLPVDATRAATVIVTSDPALEQLDGFRGSTVALALLACDQSGVDIKAKRIWSDREALIAKLGDGQLKEWLESQ